MSATPDAATLAEQSVLGALLLDSSARSRCNGLAREHFSTEQHRLIFAAVCDALEDAGASDQVTVFERLQRSGKAEDAGGIAYLNSLAHNTPSAANVAAYAELVEKHARRRQRLAALEQAREAVERGDEEAARESLARAAELAEEPQRKAAELPQLLDLAELARTEPEAPRFIVNGWLPAAEVTLLAAHGGAGKSLVALTLAICIAAGRSFYGVAVERRRVLVLSLEDGREVLHWRAQRICAWLGVELSSLAGWLTIADGSSFDTALYHETRAGAELTFTYAWLEREMRSREVLILDNASDAYFASEIQRQYVRQFVRSLRRLVPPTGACLLLAHVDKLTAKSPDTQQAFSGSTAWHNSCRARWYLRPSEDGELTLECQKSNHGATGGQIAIRWLPEAGVFAGQVTLPAGKLERQLAEVDEREVLVRLIREADQAGDAIPAASSGRRTAWHALAARPGFPPALKSPAGRTRFWQSLEQLRAAGAVRAESVRKPNRHVVEVLRAG